MNLESEKKCFLRNPKGRHWLFLFWMFKTELGLKEQTLTKQVIKEWHEECWTLAFLYSLVHSVSRYGCSMHRMPDIVLRCWARHMVFYPCKSTSLDILLFESSNTFSREADDTNHHFLSQCSLGKGRIYMLFSQMTVKFRLETSSNAIFIYLVILGHSNLALMIT